jgi:hypothetical protein
MKNPKLKLYIAKTFRNDKTYKNSLFVGTSKKEAERVFKYYYGLVKDVQILDESPSEDVLIQDFLMGDTELFYPRFEENFVRKYGCNNLPSSY